MCFEGSSDSCQAVPAGPSAVVGFYFLALPFQSSVKLKFICGQVLKDLQGEGIDVSEGFLLSPESGDVKATIAVLSFILSSAAKHSVDSDSLSNELQQLGLRKEHAAGLCRSYEEKQSPLQDSLRTRSLRLNHLDSVSWRVDQMLSSSELQQVNEPLVHLGSPSSGSYWQVSRQQTGSLELLASSPPCRLVLPLLCARCSPYWPGQRSAVSMSCHFSVLAHSAEVFSALL
uniref:COMM domain-containing protein n=1 Tax=Chelonoidis abingdonii TaxID=106734 RepID=A0A8C0IZ58_CHEAB